MVSHDDAPLLAGAALPLVTKPFLGLIVERTSENETLFAVKLEPDVLHMHACMHACDFSCM